MAKDRKEKAYESIRKITAGYPDPEYRKRYLQVLLDGYFGIYSKEESYPEIEKELERLSLLDHHGKIDHFWSMRDRIEPKRIRDNFVIVCLSPIDFTEDLLDILKAAN